MCVCGCKFYSPSILTQSLIEVNKYLGYLDYQEVKIVSVSRGQKGQDLWNVEDWKLCLQWVSCEPQSEFRYSSCAAQVSNRLNSIGPAIVLSRSCFSPCFVCKFWNLFTGRLAACFLCVSENCYLNDYSSILSWLLFCFWRPKPLLKKLKFWLGSLANFVNVWPWIWDLAHLTPMDESQRSQNHSLSNLLLRDTPLPGPLTSPPSLAWGTFTSSGSSTRTSNTVFVSSGRAVRCRLAWTYLWVDRTSEPKVAQLKNSISMHWFWGMGCGQLYWSWGFCLCKAYTSTVGLFRRAQAVLKCICLGRVLYICTFQLNNFRQENLFFFFQLSDNFLCSFLGNIHRSPESTGIARIWYIYWTFEVLTNPVSEQLIRVLLGCCIHIHMWNAAHLPNSINET